MSSVQIRDVPDDVLGALKWDASHRGESLQVYLSGVLAEQAHRAAVTAAMDESAADVASSRVDEFDSAALVRAGRDERDRQLAERAGM